MASTTRIEVQPCSDADMAECFAAASRGFAHDAPFFDIYFPDHDTDQGRAAAVARLLEWKREAPNSHFLKAVRYLEHEGASSTSSPPQIIGFAVWTHMTEPPSAKLDELEAVETVWPDPQDREYMTRLWKEYVVPRSRVVQEAAPAGIYVLELLGVDAQHHRQGAGTALVKWGTHKADQRGLAAIVEATSIGRRTYEKCGFVVLQEEMEFDVGDEFRHRAKPLLLFMQRRVA